MEKHNKVRWKKGLDITPEILIESDNFHISERNLLGRFFASRLYGILPDRKFCIEKDIDYDYVYIQKLACLAITSDGHLLNVHNDMPIKLSLDGAAGIELYVVLTVDPYTPTTEYNFVLKKTGETIKNGIPLFKICKNERHWEIDENYIPPVVVLYAVDELKRQYAEMKEKLEQIIEKLPENAAVYLQTMLLKLELDNYSMRESPEELVLLLKKICWTLKLFIKTSKKIDELPEVQRFMNEQYNHNEIWKILQLGVESLVEIDQQIEKEEVVEEEYEMKI